MRNNSPNLKGLKNAWLSPTGRLIIGDKKEALDLYAWHQDIACVIIRDEQGFKSHKDAFFWVAEMRFNYSPTQYLEDRKWIRLQSLGNLKPRWIKDAFQRLTKAQERVIVDWCEANDRRYDDAFSK